MARKPASKTRKATRAKSTPSARRSKTARSGASRVTLATPSGVSDKEHLVSVIQESSGCGKGAAKQTLDNIVASITASLKKNQRVQLVGFGSFEVTRRPARKGRNPRTGDSIRVKASKGVRFKAGQTLKRAV